MREAAAKKPAAASPSAGEAGIPAELAVELERNPQAQVFFEQMPPSHQREYILVISEAKQAETRQKRAAAAIPMLLEWGARRSSRN